MKKTILSYGGGLDSWVILLLVLYGVVCGDLKATKRTACSFLIEGKKSASSCDKG
jgi:hypothetical protein